MAQIINDDAIMRAITNVAREKAEKIVDKEIEKLCNKLRSKKPELLEDIIPRIEAAYNMTNHSEEIIIKIK